MNNYLAGIRLVAITDYVIVLCDITDHKSKWKLSEIGVESSLAECR